MNVLLALFRFISNLLLGCRHESLTRPFTIEHQTYKVCLDCGRHLYYSPETMRPIRRVRQKRQQEHTLPAGELVMVPVTVKSRSKAVA